MLLLKEKRLNTKSISLMVGERMSPQRALVGFENQIGMLHCNI
jgi:hypothetical protein